MAVPYTCLIVGVNTRRTNLQTPFAVSMLCFSQFPPILLCISAKSLPCSGVLWLNDTLGNRFGLERKMSVFLKGLAAYRQTHLMPLVYLATDGTLLSELLVLLQGADIKCVLCGDRETVSRAQASVLALPVA